MKTYLREPGIVSSANRRRESGSDGLSRGFIVAGNLELNNAMNPDIGSISRLEEQVTCTMISSLMNNPLALLADPPARYVDGALMDYLIIETVSALRVSATVSAVRAKKIEQEMAETGLLPPPPVSKSHEQRDSIGSTTARSSSYVDEEDEGLRSRLEAMGLHVGANLAERLELSTVSRRCKPIFVDYLEIDPSFLTRSTRSSLYARNYGLLAGTSK